MISKKKTSNKIKQKNKINGRADSKHWELQCSIDTVEQAVDFLIVRLEPELVHRLKIVTKEDASVEIYREMGMFVRAKFGLWQKGNINLLRSCGDENMFADTASGIILDSLVNRIRE